MAPLSSEFYASNYESKGDSLDYKEPLSSRFKYILKY